MNWLTVILIITMKLNRNKRTKANCCPTAFTVKKQKSKNKIRQKPSKTKKLCLEFQELELKFFGELSILLTSIKYFKFVNTSIGNLFLLSHSGSF